MCQYYKKIHICNCVSKTCVDRCSDAIVNGITCRLAAPLPATVDPEIQGSTSSEPEKQGDQIAIVDPSTCYRPSYFACFKCLQAEARQERAELAALAVKHQEKHDEQENGHATVSGKDTVLRWGMGANTIRQKKAREEAERKEKREREIEDKDKEERGKREEVFRKKGGTWMEGASRRRRRGRGVWERGALPWGRESQNVEGEMGSKETVSTSNSGLGKKRARDMKEADTSTEGPEKPACRDDFETREDMKNGQEGAQLRTDGKEDYGWKD